MKRAFAMAVILGAALSISPGTWLNLQMNWDHSQLDRSKMKRVKPIKKAA